jgi:hypothetical protein
VNTRATLGLTAGALVVGLLGGLALGRDGSKPGKVIGPGPRKTVAGVPVGYEHSKIGAVRAALAYQATIASLARANGPGTAAIAVMSSKPDRQAISDALAPGVELVKKALGENGFVRTASVGYRVNAYEPDNAEITIWGVSLLSPTGSPAPQSGWSTTKLRLKWTEGDWKLVAPPDGSDGPTPALRDAPTDPGALARVASSLEEVGYAPTG